MTSPRCTVAVKIADTALMGKAAEAARVDPPAEAHRGRDAADHRCRAGNRVVLPAGVFAGHVTISIGMLVHELSVRVALVNAMRLFVGGVSAPHITRRPRRARGSEPRFRTASSDPSIEPLS